MSLSNVPTIDFSRLGRAELARMAACGREILEIERILAKTGVNVVGDTLQGSDRFYEWSHYPSGDVYDPESHGQFFYHAHPSESRPGEHGHFHAFMRPRGMVPGTSPLMFPELAIADAPSQPNSPVMGPVAQPNQGSDNDKPSHLVAIAMDASGRPIRLFTTNRWVTGETWYAANDVIAMLDRFMIDLARPSWALNRWITAMFGLFRPQMAELIAARDATIMHWRRRHRGKVHVFEDRRLEITSSTEIDIAAQLGAVERALKAAA